MAKYFTLSSPLSRCPYTFFSEDGDIYHSFSPISVQTTRHFFKNNTLFSTKRHVVFYKTTRRFFFTESYIAARRFCHSLLTSTQSFFPLSQFCFLRVQTFLKKHLLARVYAPASQEFLLFCCHKCHKFFINYYISAHCTKQRYFLTIKTC